MFDKIKAELNEIMKRYTDSRQPTDDEVTIAWLVAEVDRLKELITTTKDGTAVAAITNYVVTGTRVYGPVADDSDLDLVMPLGETCRLRTYLMDHNVNVFQTEAQESYNDTGTAGFYFSLGGLLINIIIPENQTDLRVWDSRTEGMKKRPPISDKEERLKMFRSL